MLVPSYFLQRPSVPLDAATIASFEQLYTEAIEPGKGAEIEYKLEAPKWQFLCYLCDHKGLLLHGSDAPDIEEFEPRQSNDIHEFGNRRAVYAASDGIWPMYFAIVDRAGYVTSLANACVRVLEEDGTKSGPYYYFSINEDALPHNPWRNGVIYILPRDTFEQQPPAQYQGMTIVVEQWASLVEVKPLAKLAVGPDDFPFLADIHGHNPKVMSERATRDPGGFPWLDE